MVLRVKIVHGSYMAPQAVSTEFYLAYVGDLNMGVPMILEVAISVDYLMAEWHVCIVERFCWPDAIYSIERQISTFRIVSATKR